MLGEKSFFIVLVHAKIAKDAWNSLYVNFEMKYVVNRLHFKRVLYI